MSAGAARAAPVRGTQSFVATLAECWSHPGWTAIEILWRWALGIPALLLVGRAIRQVLIQATQGTLSPARLGLDAALINDPVGQLTADPMAAVASLSRAFRAVEPGLARVAFWALPLLLLLGVLVSGIGRTLLLQRVLERADHNRADHDFDPRAARTTDPRLAPKLHRRLGTVMALHALRLLALAATAWLWLRAMAAVERFAIAQPIAMGQEPGLVLYCALAIVLSLAIFVAWGLVSWWFGVAPLLALLEGRGVVASLRAAAQVRGLGARLVEINLVMGIVKIALIVLLMVFSACPLPFESVESPAFLFWWCAGVVVLYFVASDFFHVARLVSYLHLLPGDRQEPIRP